MTTLAEKIQSLTPEQRSRLLGRLLRKEATPSSATPAIEALVPDPDSLHSPFPLTDIQEAYWVGRQAGFELGNVAAHGYLEVDCRGLDEARFERAWNRLVARHDMLRAVFSEDGTQRILPEVPAYAFPVRDLREATAAERERVAASIREEMSHQVLDASSWPLFDLRFTRLDAETTRLHVSIDVLILDAMSFDILSRELSLLYFDPDRRLPPIGLSYRDYVLAAIRAKASERHAEVLRWWKERVAGLPPGPELALARSPRSIARPRFARRTRFLDAAAWARLKQGGRAIRCTPSAVLLTAYADVLRRWSRRGDFTLNVTLFDRQPFHPDVNRVVGDFTSVMLVAVPRPAPEADFAARVRQVQERLWLDMDHGQVSGVEVMRLLSEAQGRTGGAAMPVVFTSALSSDGELGTHAPLAWLGPTVYTVTQTPQVWLDFQVTEDRGGVVCDWDAVEEIFPPGMLDDMFASLGDLLARLCAEGSDWSAAAAELPSAQVRLMESANATRAPVPEGLLHEPFLRRAAESPERSAVITRGRTLDYGELRRYANRIARHLDVRGAEPGRLVAVLMRKGWEQVAAVLGILESGQAYLPLDPDLPTDRLNYLLSVCEVTQVLSTSDVLAAAPLPGKLEGLAVDALDVSAWAVDDLPRRARSGDIAYVIFTSGSTGLPKGVVIDHRGALNTVVDVNSRFAIGAGDRTLCLSSLSFDLSVYDIFGLLAAGGAVVMPKASRHPDPGEWAGLLQDFDVTLWNTVPALLDMLMVHLDEAPARPSCLRTVMLSGDWIPLALPDRARARFPEARIFSLGGATEASIWSILYSIGDVKPEWRSIPYGKAMINQTFHVLDGDLRPCPVLVQGDLYIGGIGLALGYWKDAEKTAASFITHSRTGERLYRTGDQGRWMPDGEIEFLGRNDFQVKINGFRVELGEIESVLLEHPGVKQAVAHVAGERAGARRVVAYVVPEAAPTSRSDSSGEAAPKTYRDIPLILDPSERLRFRMGVRRWRDLGSEVAVALASGAEARWSGSAVRKSHRRFEARPVTLAELEELLSVLREGEEGGRPKRAYGSAGSLYPVQVYLLAKPGAVVGLEAGLYYYHPGRHSLELLASGAPVSARDFDPYNRPLVESGALALFLVGDMASIAPLYGEHAREFCLIEAGLVSQALESACVGGSLGLCQVGAFDFAAVAPAFRLPARHEYLHCLVGGPKLPVGADPGEAEAGSAADAMPGEREASRSAGESFAEELVRHARGKLPQYMVPSQVVLLESLPLSSNGKVDRKALPAVESARGGGAGSAAGAAAPMSGLEERIAAVWREVLKVESVGSEDNFFELGGTSIHMVNIHTRLQRVLGRKVTLLDMFFNHPSISTFAAFLAGSGAGEGGETGNGEVGNGAPESGRRERDKRRNRRLEARLAEAQ